MTDQPTPATPSSDHTAMAQFWGMVRDILGGAPAMRKNCESYLPKLPEETTADHDSRVALSPFTNIYGDISGNLASKPFAKELCLSDATPVEIAGTADVEGERSGGLADNIDAQGNNLHVFASNSFKEGVDKGLTWILVDFTRARPTVEGRPLSQAEEQAQGLRPYWVHLPPEQVIAAYSVAVGGVDTLFHARVLECEKVRNGFGEKEVKRVRVMDRAFLDVTPDGAPTALGPATWTLYEEQKRDGKDQPEWVEIDAGAYSIGLIPLVPVFIGQRVGASFRVIPPLRDLAYMQVEEYQQEANLKSISMLTAFPMLAGNGVNPPVDKEGEAIVVPVGPRSVLFAPPNNDGNHGEWKFIEPSAESLKFLEERLNTFRDQMRDLGMQPLARSNLTVVTSANLSRKASSQVQKWAILFEDALDQALAITCKWLGIPDEASAEVYKDFSVEAEEGEELTALLNAEKQRVVSKQTVAEEFKRRGVLSDDYDHEKDQLRLADEQADATGEQNIDPVTGAVLPDNGPAV
ncbi:hypothetical protein GGQ86_002986 [Xanthobacter flavus]|uniref:DUF4055 domain-containing protein n=1 Tax=Xanthobacter flavus TaxID=281 RepID=A0A9W6FKM3_XANFL|nr:DUF4055 domain-containing protein [Xanthobacter flavus]MDR6334504.1 hypothetical protein [Xanthobacter flavus]GLI23476.1 hypothetical protein XFLAVUS301_31500 [Xanthobacter flavus]